MLTQQEAGFQLMPNRTIVCPLKLSKLGNIFVNTQPDDFTPVKIVQNVYAQPDDFKSVKIVQNVQFCRCDRR